MPSRPTLDDGEPEGTEQGKTALSIRAPTGGEPGGKPSWCRSCHGRPRSTRPGAAACMPALVCVVLNPARSPVPGRSNPKEEVR